MTTSTATNSAASNFAASTFAASTDKHYRATCPSPLGELTLVSTDTGLRVVSWEGEEPNVAGLPLVKDIESSPSHPIIAATIQQFAEYFGSRRCDFDLPLDLRGTEFQQQAWRALATIPGGKTASYGEQARRIGRPKAVRAIGNANGRNPVPIVLPCHRVIGSNAALTGYSGAGGLKTKQFLLDLEQNCNSTDCC